MTKKSEEKQIKEGRTEDKEEYKEIEEEKIKEKKERVG